MHFIISYLALPAAAREVRVKYRSATGVTGEKRWKGEGGEEGGRGVAPLHSYSDQGPGLLQFYLIIHGNGK